MEVECEGFTFTSNFDSGNLAKVEYVPKIKTTSNGKATPNGEIPDFEFNLWTKPDCAGTEFENGNRTWFYFGIKGGAPFALVKLNIVNLNRQAKLFSEGMTPVYRVVPGRPSWERIHDKPTFAVSVSPGDMEQKRFVLSFKYRTLENLRATSYFAFTYPYSHTELQNSLRLLDAKCEVYKKQYEESKDPNCIYYHRECVCWSLEQRRVDLLTVTSHHGASAELEPRLNHLFPEINVPRPISFPDKKVVFVSARVHPGETPSSFVLSGMLSYLLQPNDPVAQILRKNFVFKFIPSLNPDGVANGHYRTDTRGVNLNRVYLNPSLILHPTIYAARSLIRYYHYGCEMPEEDLHWDSALYTTSESSSPEVAPILDIKSKVSILSLVDSDSSSSADSSAVKPSTPESQERSTSEPTELSKEETTAAELEEDEDKEEEKCHTPEATTSEPPESNLFMYLDLHGHASKKGVFMYGNYFENIEESTECMLMPKVMSLNNSNFHFTACNFTKRNMYLRDRRDGMSREGSGRVAVFKLTGLVQSYTLECNYNTGRLVNSLPPSLRDANKPVVTPVVPPKYTPQIFEEVGRALAISVLDVAGSNPWSRLRNSEHRGLQGLRDWLKRYIQLEQSNPARCGGSGPQRQTSAQVTPSGPSSLPLAPSAGPSSLSSAVNHHHYHASSSSSGATTSSRPPRLGHMARLKTHHLTPLPKAKPLNSIDVSMDSEKKENLITTSLSVETSTKIKNPMSPRENITPLPSLHRGSCKTNAQNSKTPTQKQASMLESHSSKVHGNMLSNGRVTKVRRSSDKLSHKPSLTSSFTSTNAGHSGLIISKKINRSMSSDKGEVGARGVQMLKQGTKRLKISSVIKTETTAIINHIEVSKGEGGDVITLLKQTLEESIVHETATISKRLQKFTSYATEAEIEDARLWERNNDVAKPGIWKNPVVRGMKTSPRKLLTQTSLSGPSSVHSSKQDLQASSSNKGTKHSVKVSQARVPHLSPIKSLHKSNSIVKKKSMDWEKKRGKSSFRNLPAAKSASSTGGEPSSILDSSRKKPKSKVLLS